MVDSLSKTRHLFVVMSNMLVGFEEMKTEYSSDPYFDNIIATLSAHDHVGLHSFEYLLLVDDFLFKVLNCVFHLVQDEKNL